MKQRGGEIGRLRPDTAAPLGRLDARLRRLISDLAGRRVLVIGDLIADEFIVGRVARLSREAPVLILEYDATDVVPGGAGNAAANVASLGGTPRLIAAAGTDDVGCRVVGALGRSVDTSALTRPRGYDTPVKTRIVAGGVHTSKQQVVRIDRRPGTLSQDARDDVTQRLAALALECDAVLVSDYGLGFVTPEVITGLAALTSGWPPARRLPILIDSRHSLAAYRGFTACTPNQEEVEQMLGTRLDGRAGALEEAGREVLRRTAMQAVVITRGSQGMALFEPDRPTLHIPISGSDEVADVTGAGDTVIATMTLALAAGASFPEAARLANYAGGLVVLKRGTATISRDELRAAVARDLGADNAERQAAWASAS